MKLPKTYFNNLTVARYREYLKLLPETRKENTKVFIMLVFTFIALSFFGIFAINPTLSTIVDLKKQLADSTFVRDQLTTKISNLSLLNQKYNLITADLPLVFEAIPQSASIPLLTGQIQSLAQSNKIAITSFRISEVQLSSNKQSESHNSSFTFFLEAEGLYSDMLNFSSALANFNRIVTVESLSVSRDTQKDDLVFAIRGKAYFKN